MYASSVVTILELAFWRFLCQLKKTNKQTNKQMAYFRFYLLGPIKNNYFTSLVQIQQPIQIMLAVCLIPALHIQLEGDAESLLWPVVTKTTHFSSFL